MELKEHYTFMEGNFTNLSPKFQSNQMEIKPQKMIFDFLFQIFLG